MAEYWRFYEPVAPAISGELRSSLLELPEWAPILRAQTPSQIAEGDRRSIELQRAAIIDNEWTPYLEDLRVQGATYAKLGVSFVAWFDILAIFRETIRRQLASLARTEFDRASRIGDGMNRFLDIAMAHIGEAYLGAKEVIIAQQQLAIRELSLPILQVRDRLLIAPLVGLIDGTRARQLIETLLVAIRDRRAKGIVLDVTGVPVVDSHVANHLVQACDAARLMGATIVISGISPEMAETLVALGAKLPQAETQIDLQAAIDHIERELGYRDSV